ncbi:uncharacterized protein EV420DRAFT_1745211 [Desarmillaria tabescens]|uniref:CBM21 domain-containing protein n=1 Tax=Armillaria tabescens TaxID=1929756 RepID=A0AA39NDT0_ARMTA|nr:uncharacterized protein EV420DRAFT_1745211 [Desarmillaria tabescens]KAK0463669.1 hypothetical protein EV420DRAFT_1745211 [Desarmillaria tabescens]
MSDRRKGGVWKEPSQFCAEDSEWYLARWRLLLHLGSNVTRDLIVAEASFTTAPPTSQRKLTADRRVGRCAFAPQHRPVFHFQNDNDDHDLLGPRTAIPLQVDTHLGITFPRSSPEDVPNKPSPPQRSNSTPVLLSNGRPLKSSLKSSPRSSSVPDMPLVSIQHYRARSASSAPAISYHEHPCHKNVHFSTHQLETVRMFNRSAKPASLFRTTPSSDAETETETEDGSSRIAATPRFPFPFAIPSYSLSPFTDPVPSLTVPRKGSNIILESLILPQSTLALKGTLLVRNISYEKQGLRVATGGSATWDRFEYTIQLGDYTSTLIDRTIFLVARYSTGGGEWWDNNAGKNYRVAFIRSPNHASLATIKKARAPVPLTKTPFESSVPFPTIAPPSPTNLSVSVPSTSTLSPTLSPPPQHNRAQSEATLRHHLEGLKLPNYAKPNTVPLQLSPTTERAEGGGVFWFGTFKPQTDTSPVHSDKGWRCYAFSIQRQQLPTGLAHQGTGERVGIDGHAIRPEREPILPSSSSGASPTLSSASTLPGGKKSPSSPPSSPEDLYNAFLKQWCFASSSLEEVP